MNDTMGLVYDAESAMALGVQLTGFARETLEKYQRGKDLFEFGTGILGEDITFHPEEAWLGRDSGQDGDTTVTPAEFRRRYPRFFPERNVRDRFLDTGLERRFVAEISGLSEGVVAACQGAHDEYMRRVGIMEAV